MILLTGVLATVPEEDENFYGEDGIKKSKFAFLKKMSLEVHQIVVP